MSKGKRGAPPAAVVAEPVPVPEPPPPPFEVGAWVFVAWEDSTGTHRSRAGQVVSVGPQAVCYVPSNDRHVAFAALADVAATDEACQLLCQQRNRGVAPPPWQSRT